MIDIAEQRGSKYYLKPKYYASSVKTLRGWNALLSYDFESKLPEEFFVRSRGTGNLTDTEVLAICLITLFLGEGEYSFLIWELRLYMLEHCQKTVNLRGLLVLESNSYQVAVSRIYNLSPEKAEIFFRRNFSSGLSTGLHKLKVVCSSTRPPTETQRKLGYNDQGSLAPPSTSARRNARAFWFDTLLQEEIEAQRRQIKDTLSFLEGFTD